MEIGNDPDFGNTHGEELFEYYVRIEGEAVTRSVAQKELALWIHMVALELGKTKLAGEAGTYAKRLIDEGYDTVQGFSEHCTRTHHTLYDILHHTLANELPSSCHHGAP